MAAGVYDITIYSNEWLKLVITYKNSDGTAVDLTGFDVRVEVGQTGCKEPLLVLSKGDGVVLDAVGGIDATATTERLESAGIVPGSQFKYRMTLVEPSSKPRVLLTGKLKVIC